ncbi:MAG TPA: NADH:flavin oxidoreductase [Acidimicrobiales bacterium]|jgi:2,4-dienoyl-CoA reductase-like NADH-dependent reductase (Old Yellow Enzyme family)|nr:NADH:flavin oxidoreductase [Acidimicrobiales bacterium]
MTPTVFEPARLGPVTLRNRIIKAATFEGASPQGLVTPALVDYHLRVADGGVGMTTVAYLAVSPEGRTDRRCLQLRPEVAEGLAGLTAAVHRTGAAVAAQIGHAGPVANPKSNRAPALAPSRTVSPLGSVIRAATGEDIERITDDFSRGAALAAAAGFDAVEVHLGHNYLLSAFLSPKLNRRTDRWGGTVENRARFPRQVLAAVREAVGPGVAVTAKLNMADGVPGGLWLDDSLRVAALLEADGHLDALELTGGSSLANPMYLFRGEVPRREFAATLPPAARLGFGLVGRRFMPEYPFEEAFFLPYARQFREALQMPLIMLGGINRLDTIEHALGEGFAFVAMARALLREPDLVNRMQAGTATESLCIHCNKCMPTIYRGTHCVLAGP